MTPYYERNGITIYCGDCLIVMPRLIYFSPDLKFDAIIADWPYGTTACSWDSVIPLDELWPLCKMVIKKNGVIVLTADEPFTSRLISNDYDWFKYRWVWEKTLAANFLNAKLRPLQRHEDIIVFSPGATSNGHKNNMTYNPQGLKKTNHKWSRPSKYPSEHKMTRPSHKLNRVIEYSGYPDTILKFSNGNNKNNHPTQKPVALMSYLIRTYTNPGEIILDNTIGSGTTLVAAQNEGRRAVGIEISEEYCQIAVERLRQSSFFSIPDEPKAQHKQLTIDI